MCRGKPKIPQHTPQAPRPVWLWGAQKTAATMDTWPHGRGLKRTLSIAYIHALNKYCLSLLFDTVLFMFQARALFFLNTGAHFLQVRAWKCFLHKKKYCPQNRAILVVLWCMAQIFVVFRVLMKQMSALFADILTFCQKIVADKNLCGKNVVTCFSVIS